MNSRSAVFLAFFALTSCSVQGFFLPSSRSMATRSSPSTASVMMTSSSPTTSKEHTFKNVQNVFTKSSIALSTAAFLSSSSIVHADASTDATNPSKFTTTDSGLKYFDIKEGDGNVPKPGDTVRVHYTGWLDNFESEKKFDSSYDRRSPLVFPVGQKRVIAGWEEGILTGLKVGGKRNLIIPPDLGYGARGAGGVIPPGATLYFTIELVGIGAR